MIVLMSRVRPGFVASLFLATSAGTAAGLAGALPGLATWALLAAQVALGLALAGHGLALDQAVAAVAATARAARGGDLAARTGATGLGGAAGALAAEVDGALALTGRVVRDGAEALAAASAGEPHRAIPTDGLGGGLLAAADGINAALARISRGPALVAEVERSIGAVLEAAASGDLSRRIDTRLGDPAMARLAAGVDGLVATVERSVAETGAVLAALAAHDTSGRVRGEYRGAFDALKQNANAVAANLEAIVTAVVDALAKLKAGQAQILAGATELADRSNAGATAVSQTSAAMEQISVTTAENARKAAAGTERADTVATSIEGVRSAMQDADAAVQRIRSASEEISGIVALIDSIAFQTRLLALNASIEAARAGEAGRGFAVVASEVRNLAERVVTASSEIKGLVAQSGSEVEHGSVLVADAGAQLGSILDLIRANARDMKEIATACGEQANAVGEISAAVSQLEDVTAQNAALVDRTTAQLVAADGELGALEAAVGRFTLGRATRTRSLPASAAAAPPAPAPRAPRQPEPKAIARPQAAPARSPARRPAPPPAVGNTALDADWSEF